jgi:pimeloyl-[acyl-carrier protein] synthase
VQRRSEHKSQEVDHDLSLLRLREPRIAADPHRLYSALFKQGPVLWDPYTHAWVVTGYSEVVQVLTKYSAERAPDSKRLDELGLGVMKPFADMMRRQMLFMDEPMHSCLRSLCSAAFTTSRVQALAAFITSVADELLEGVIRSGHIDILADFAVPLPAIVTAKLMGIPTENYRQLSNWINDIAEVHGNFMQHPHRMAQILKSFEEMKQYVADRMVELRKCGNDGLLCGLMNAKVEGRRLTDDEVMASAFVTIIGGHETTTNLIANGFLTLLLNPDSFQQLCNNPAIVVSAVEELLRYESPVQYTARVSRIESELSGNRIFPGHKLIAVLAAANRDPHFFSDPDHLDLLRSDNRHLAFGWGSHFCFGAPLARLEAQIAFQSLLRRLQRPFLIDRAVTWRPNSGIRGLTELRVGFEPA